MWWLYKRMIMEGRKGEVWVWSTLPGWRRTRSARRNTLAGWRAVRKWSGTHSMPSPATGSIPVLTARGSPLAAAWENSLLALWKDGAEIRTEYDACDTEGRYLDPPSIDATVTSFESS